MFPTGRQTIGYRVGGSTAVEHKLMSEAVRATDAWSVVGLQSPVFPIEVRSRRPISSAPTAEGNHLVVDLPERESVVGSMINHHSAATLHIGGESCIHVSRPVVAVVIEHHQPVLAEIHREAGHVFSVLGRHCHIEAEQPRVLERHLDGLMAHRPVVVVLPGDDDATKGLLCVGAEEGGKQRCAG